MQDTTKARPKSPGRRVTDLNQVTLQQKLRENVKAVSTASGCILKICRVKDGRDPQESFLLRVWHGNVVTTYLNSP